MCCMFVGMKTFEKYLCTYVCIYFASIFDILVKVKIYRYIHIYYGFWFAINTVGAL